MVNLDRPCLHYCRLSARPYVCAIYSANPRLRPAIRSPEHWERILSSVAVFDLARSLKFLLAGERDAHAQTYECKRGGRRLLAFPALGLGAAVHPVFSAMTLILAAY